MTPTGYSTQPAQPTGRAVPCIAAADWAAIERGLCQRARLMEAVLADLYGPRRLLHDALLPAALVLRHPMYLRAAHGIAPAGGRRLFALAFDLVWLPEGGFRLLAQQAAHPAGLGALCAGVGRSGQPGGAVADWADAAESALAEACRAWFATLRAANPAGPTARWALWTAGPDAPGYRDDWALARHMGASLVRGCDLGVRDQRLVRLTMRGLEPVHGLLRMTADDALDPLELRPDAADGVPGLMQALRRGGLVLANAAGAGVLDSPGLHAFWPGVCEALFGEPLCLPSVWSWWCGEPAVWQAERDRLAQYECLSAFAPAPPPVVEGTRRDWAASERQRAAIDADPAAHVLRQHLPVATTAVDADGRWRPGATLRVLALADGAEGWRLLPAAPIATALPAAVPHRAPVPSAPPTPAAPSTAPVPAPGPCPDAGCDAALGSRAAENLYWFGRYAERAECSQRLLQALAEASARPTPSPAWQAWALAMLRRHRLLDAATEAALAAAPQAAVQPDAAPNAWWLAWREACRAAAPGAARTAPVNPLPGWVDTWTRWRACAEVVAETLGSLGEARWPTADTAELPALLDLTRDAPHRDALRPTLSSRTVAAAGGQALADAARLQLLGRAMERLDTWTHALALALDLALDLSDDGPPLLAACIAPHYGDAAPAPPAAAGGGVCQALLADAADPRSLAATGRMLTQALRELGAADTAWADAVLAEGLLWPPQASPALPVGGEANRRGAWVAALRQCSTALLRLDQAIGRRWFAPLHSAGVGTEPRAP